MSCHNFFLQKYIKCFWVWPLNIQCMQSVVFADGGVDDE